MLNLFSSCIAVGKIQHTLNNLYFIIKNFCDFSYFLKEFRKNFSNFVG